MTTHCNLTRNMASLDPDGSAIIDVRGMWCTSCANAVERVLARQPGVLDAKVSFTTESAHVQWDPRQTTLERLLEPVARLGYSALPEGASHATPGQSREGCPGPTLSGRMPAQEEDPSQQQPGTR
jgi:copper chaperone CopZ